MREGEGEEGDIKREREREINCKRERKWEKENDRYGKEGREKKEISKRKRLVIEKGKVSDR